MLPVTQRAVARHAGGDIKTKFVAGTQSALVSDEGEVFFIYRSYMEPGTKVSPDDDELLYDQAIHFGPCFEP